MYRVAAGAALAAILQSGSPTEPPQYVFHHLHVNAQQMRAFYERLFDPSKTEITTFGSDTALRSESMLLVFGPASRIRERDNAIWHFGWGAVSLGETYIAHAAHEVEWNPPLSASQLHLHVLSPSPAASAGWYRDVLGATIQTAPGGRVDATDAQPELRVAEAIVSFGGFALAIYRTNLPLAPTRGQRVDHFALTCAALDGALEGLRQHGVPIVQPPTAIAGTRAAMIEGPDGMAIELVEKK